MVKSRTEYQSSNREEVFWGNVTKGPHCWMWTGALMNKGRYGTFGWKGVHTLAHRFSWEIANGPIPEGLVVRHTCDVGLCVNPDHLLIGTQSDNMRDSFERLRPRRGEQSGTAKLTEQGVIAIRRERAAGLTFREICERHGMSQMATWRAATGVTWRHVPMLTDSET